MEKNTEPGKSKKDKADEVVSKERTQSVQNQPCKRQSTEFSNHDTISHACSLQNSVKHYWYLKMRKHFTHVSFITEDNPKEIVPDLIVCSERTNMSVNGRLDRPQKNKKLAVFATVYSRNTKILIPFSH
jgi:hypothetical protein